MGLVTGSDVIDAVRSALSAIGFTTSVNIGTVASNDKEVWMHLPAANTKLGYDLLYGMWSLPSSPPEATGDYLKTSLTWLSPSDALLTGVSPRNESKRILGTPSIIYNVGPQIPPGNVGDTYPGGFTLTNNNDASPVTVDGFAQGTNYLNHWIFTPSGNSPLGSKEFYCYVVVEVSTGIYRSFGFGEGIKLGASGWEGGLFIDGSNAQDTNQSRQRWFLAGDSDYSTFTNDGEHGYILNFNNEQYNVDSPRAWNPWMFMGAPWSNNWMTCAGMGPRSFGNPYLTESPGAFNGQSMRLPARFYAMDNIVSSTDADIGSPSSRDNNMRPLIECPDIFHTNIKDMTPGGTIEDDVEKFVVFPYYSKDAITNTSLNFGFLIRSDDL